MSYMPSDPLPLGAASRNSPVMLYPPSCSKGRESANPT
jgi:hypothetical protein